MRAEVYKVQKPEELQVSSKAIVKTIEDIRLQNKLELHSFLMLRKGRLIWEQYFRPNEQDHLHVLHSVTKSFMSTAIGIAQAQGLLHIKDPLYSFFPQYRHLCDSDWKRQISLQHVLMMGSGFENNEAQIFGNKDIDLIAAALSQNVIYEPGSRFQYYSLGSYLAGAAFQQVNPEGIHAYLKRKLFIPLQITKSRWEKCNQGIPFGGFGLHLSAYDLTKLGQLYLQRGVWEGQQLLPESYVQEATRKQIDNSPGRTDPDWTAGYGYQFWCNAMGGFRADGMNGQYIVVLPEKEAVIVMTSRLHNMQIPLAAIQTILLPAMES